MNRSTRTLRGIATRLTAGLALALGAIVALSSCTLVSVTEPPRLTSTPTGEPVASDLQSYYSQELTWRECHRGLQCAIAKAPLDWSDPQRDEIELSLIRHTASNPIGSLLINPGGPGGSGVEIVRDSLRYVVSDRLIANFDIVGFDPRGVGSSSAIRCASRDEDLDRFLYQYEVGDPERGSDEWLDEGRAEWRELGEACLEHSGELLGYVDTTSAARDLDLLRAILGDEQLHYLGYSYGTLLGASFAELYPERAGRLVLDGALDPATSLDDVVEFQSVGFENALRAYLESCLEGARCPFRGTAEAGMQRVAALMSQLDRSPLRAPDGRLLGASTMFTAIILPLYSADTWSYLDDLFASVFSGDPEFAFVLADAYNDRDSDGNYANNSSEAFWAINCLDYVNTATNDEVRASTDRLVTVSPLFGPYMGYDTSCDGWPYPATRERGPIHAVGAPPIIVIGTTGDPATPYEWAVNLADQLESGQLVTFDGEGHTAYNKSNRCVNNAVDEFFINGTLPTADLRC
ncbi:MAG: alpha/beta fold hydrolase [Cryobacterium sp.]|nr:alpha/beta fold hydrolase [Cryobacterium sp.]